MNWQLKQCISVLLTVALLNAVAVLPSFAFDDDLPLNCGRQGARCDDDEVAGPAIFGGLMGFGLFLLVRDYLQWRKDGGSHAGSSDTNLSTAVVPGDLVIVIPGLSITNHNFRSGVPKELIALINKTGRPSQYRDRNFTPRSGDRPENFPVQFFGDPNHPCIKDVPLGGTGRPTEGTVIVIPQGSFDPGDIPTWQETAKNLTSPDTGEAYGAVVVLVGNN